MGMFEISDETVAKYTEKFNRMAQEKVSEPVIAVAARSSSSRTLATDMFGLGGGY